jgi:hypothetical protein
MARSLDKAFCGAGALAPRLDNYSKSEPVPKTEVLEQPQVKFKNNEAPLMSIRQILFFGVVMSVIMSLCMAFAMTAINVGFGDIFLSAWLAGWGAGFVVSLPLSVFLPPFLMKVIEWLKI